MLDARWVEEGERTRTLTVGERALFAAGAPLAFVVVRTNAGYRALVV